MILYGHTAYVADWAGRQLGIADWGPCATIAVLRDMEIVAAAVFNNYRHPNIDISFATTTVRWATPHVVREILKYPFDQLGCKRISIVTEASNQRARAFALRLGFREEGIHPDALPSGDAVTLGLLASDAARWIGVGRYRQVSTIATGHTDSR